MSIAPVVESLVALLRSQTPPVRSWNPPNPAVPEDEATYRTLYDTAAAALELQRARADGLAPGGRVADFRYWFAKVYSFVTEAELDYVRDGAYFYPSYVLRSVLYFERIYADNFDAFSAGTKVEEHWRTAFDRMARDQQLVREAGQALTTPSVAGSGGAPGLVLNLMRAQVEHSADALVAGMQAHIRFDLPRAENWVYTTYYGHVPGVRQSDFRADFFNMSGVFDEAGRRMNTEMAERLQLPVDLMPQLVQDTAMRYYFDADMGTERADTWRRAEQLAGIATPDPYRMGAAGLTGSVTDADHLAGLRRLPDLDLRPSMAASAPVLDDGYVRARLAELSDPELARLSALTRVAMLRGLLRGVTGNDDEDAMLRILRASRTAEDFVAVVDAADAWELLYATDGEQYDAMRSLFRAAYYSTTQYRTAQRLVEKCIGGETADWEERMIVDIVAARSRDERSRLLSHLGGAGGAAAGAAAVRDQIDGDDEGEFDRLVEGLT